MAAATSTEEFVHLLSHTDGVLVEVVHFPSGDVRGYKVALDDDTNAGREPIWFSGSTLAPDLSLPKIHERLDRHRPRSRRPAEGGHAPQPLAPGHRRHRTHPPPPRPGRRRSRPGPPRRLRRSPRRPPPHRAPAPSVSNSEQAATAFERATRSRIQADHHHARALRGAVRAMLREPAPKDGAALAMFLDAALLVVIAAARWHQLRHHDQQVAAAHQTLLHLQAAYDQSAPALLTTIAQRKPPASTVERYAQHICAAIPAHAQRILDDPAWPALAASLAQAENTGHEPTALLAQATASRGLEDARSPAQVLTWRIQRRAHRPVPSTQALAALARSTRTVPAAAPAPPPPTLSAAPHSPAVHPGRHR